MSEEMKILKVGDDEFEIVDEKARQLIDDFEVRHFYPTRAWFHVTNQEEFEEFLNAYNKGDTSLGCYIDAAGTYRMTSETIIQPVFNACQIHIFSTVPGVVLDLYAMTYYTGHFNIGGQNENTRMKIVNTYSGDRAFYSEGGSSIFAYCDFYCSVRFWGGYAKFENCNWYDMTDYHKSVIDAIGSYILLRGCGCYITEYRNSEYALFGLEMGGEIATVGRFTLSTITTNNPLIRSLQYGIAKINWQSSLYNPDTQSSYNDSVRAGYDRFVDTNNMVIDLLVASNSPLQYAFLKNGEGLSNANVRITKNVSHPFVDRNAKMDSYPTSGTWEAGDIVYASNPSSIGYVGWVCIASGTPGTWKTFGAVSV